MTATGWSIVVGGLLLVAAAALAAWAVFARGRRTRMRSVVRRGARRLHGRLDPASDARSAPALLAELSGLLLRASGWPAEDATGPMPPYLEVCTPVEGVTSPLVVVRRAEAARLLPQLADATRRLPAGDAAAGGLLVFGHQHAAWAVSLFGRHASWALLEIDTRMLRVLTTDPQLEGFDAVAVEHAVRGIAAAAPAILLAAGRASSSAHDGQQ